ncbi:MAG: hypothetical protein ACPGUF_04015, partial [Litorivicinus sp.]
MERWGGYSLSVAFALLVHGLLALGLFVNIKADQRIVSPRDNIINATVLSVDDSAPAPIPVTELEPKVEPEAAPIPAPSPETTKLKQQQEADRQCIADEKQRELVAQEQARAEAAKQAKQKAEAAKA